MDRRRIAVVAAGLVLIGGTIVVLRGSGLTGPAVTTTPVPPPPTSLAQFAGQGVVLPSSTEKPQAPERLVVQTGPQRLQLRWTGESAGYEVRWGKNDALEHTVLVAQPVAQVDGLDDGVKYRVEVRSVDSFGRRSAPTAGSGTPVTDKSSDAKYALLDRFDQPDAPDPTRWRLATRENCARATPGQGDDARRLVISSNCAAAPVTLRSRTPFAPADSDELGRFVVETDAPGVDGELFLDLVPGPVSVVSSVPVEQASDRAVDAAGLPPGTVRARIASSAGNTTAQVLVAPGTPRIAPTGEQPHPVPAARLGISQRWEVVLRRDGVRVLRDGALVAKGEVAPQWTEATALVGIVGPSGERVHVDLIGFTGKASATPPLVPSPPVRVDVGGSPASASNPKLVPDVLGGRLRMSIVHTDGSGIAPQFNALVGGSVTVPLRPAVPDTAWRSESGYPVYADLPPEALALVGPDDHLAVSVLTPTPMRVQLTHVDLELTPEPGARTASPPSTATDALNGVELDLARVGGKVLDASGQPVPDGKPVQPGRLVLDVVLDGLEGRRTTARLPGLAGFTIRLDGEEVASVPTTTDGPAVAGQWRLALNTSSLSAGPHMIEIKAFSTESTTRPSSAFVSFFVAE
ncbi:MAG: fibronectin type III domain-containing protein [Umezawaea sp.]